MRKKSGTSSTNESSENSESLGLDLYTVQDEVTETVEDQIHQVVHAEVATDFQDEVDHAQVAEKDDEIVAEDQIVSAELDEPGNETSQDTVPAPPWLGGVQVGGRKQDAPLVEYEEGPGDEDGHRLVLVDGETFTVAEGDLLLDIDQRDLWQEALDARQEQFQTQLRIQAAGFGEAAINEYGTVSSALVGIMEDGKLVRWSPGTVLSYCVLRNTFPRQDWYEEVVTNMQLATEAWEATCGVTFDYVSSLDSSLSMRPSGVVFPVRYISAGGAFIAAAFFPNDTPTRRRMLIDPSYFRTSFDHVGVLRHELGHVIGCRHEHIRSGAPPICPDEDTTGTINLTDYDPQSVMHYFCGGVGSKKLEITQIDRIGAHQLYGPPLSNFELQEA